MRSAICLGALGALLLAACAVEGPDEEPSAIDSPDQETEAYPGCQPKDKYCGGCAIGSCGVNPGYVICPSTGQWVFASQCSPSIDDPVCRWRSPYCGSAPPPPPPPPPPTTGSGGDPPDCGGLPNCQ